MIIERKQYLNQLIKKKDNGRIKIITGIRRCGKSYLLFKLFKNYLLNHGVKEEQIIEMALDDIDHVKYRNPFELNNYIKQKTEKDQKYYVFIDEIQFSQAVKNPYIEDSTEDITFVDTLLGLSKNKNLDIYVTGSNSKMLSKDILTQFRDRGDEVHLYPLSFQEVSGLYEDKNQAWQDYIVLGGMPHLFHLDTFEEKSAYLKNLFEETYLKDIVERNNVQNSTDVLEVLLDFVSSSIGSLTNPLKLAKRFKSEKNINISHNTVAKYLTYFEDVFILHSAQRYDIKGAKYFSTPLKYYYSDVGLRNARLNFRQIEENHIMENIIYNDLIRGAITLMSASSVQSEQNGQEHKTQLEVDFVVNRSNVRYYIQSALALPTQEKVEQERNSLGELTISLRRSSS